ncbi:hypothetical protein BC826DRAFT_1191603 [Russula brevipes]|nr:hypothetical protein BC826DRAFT_1191603 [Russula brevipes]
MSPVPTSTCRLSQPGRQRGTVVVFVIVYSETRHASGEKYYLGVHIVLTPAFQNPRSYNDYLQEVEDIPFNLINEIDIPEMQVRIVAYRKRGTHRAEPAAQRGVRAGVQGARRGRVLRAPAAREELHRAEEERDACEGEWRALIDHLESSDADAARGCGS